MKTIQREVLEFIYDELDLAINRDEGEAGDITGNTARGGSGVNTHERDR